MTQTTFEHALADRQRSPLEIERFLVNLLENEAELTESRLTELTRLILAQHAEKANLVGLMNRLWLSWEKGAGEERSTRLQSLLAERRHDLDNPLAARHARHLAPRLEGRRTILTLARSHTVLTTLGVLASGGDGTPALDDMNVFFGESRPLNEGVTAARELAVAGVEVHVVTDAVLSGLPVNGVQLLAELGFDPDDAVVVLGANALATEVFVNKSGSLGLCLAARVATMPVFVLAESSMLLPPPLADEPVLPAGDPVELAVPVAVGPLNRPLEPVPWDLATSVLFEDGVFDPAGVRERIQSQPLSRTLNAMWTAERSSSDSRSTPEAG